MTGSRESDLKKETETIPSDFTPLLASKLMPPKLWQVLSRPRLLKLAKLERKTRLVTISAGAGYGKTTLMAQLAQSHPGAFVWYQVDSLDKDPAMFLRHLIEGVSHACGGTGQQSLERLGDATDLREEGESVLSVLIGEMDKNFEGVFTIYIDDFHLFEGADFSIKFVNFLVKELPQQASVVIASRTKPRLSISHLRSKRMISEIGEQDLRFSHSELDKLFHQTWNLEVPTGTIKRLYQNSEGWAAGLVLMEEHVKNGDEIPELFTKHKRIRRHVYQYLAEEVLNKNDGLRLSLMQSALIDPIDPNICAHARVVDDSGRTFESAERLNMFISRIGDTRQYRFHPLFREFLLAHLKEEFDVDDIKRLRSRFGQAFEATNDRQKAVEQFLAGGCQSDATRNLTVIWKEMISQAQYETLERWLNELGQHDLPPELMICQGELLMAKGKYEQALGILDTAKLSISPKETELRCHCAIAVAECLSETGRNSEGIADLESMVHSNVSPETQFELLYRLGKIYLINFDEERFNRCFESAKQIVETNVLSRKLAQINVMSAVPSLGRGEFQQAYNLLNHANEAQGTSARNSNIIANNLASCLMMMSKYIEALNQSTSCLNTILQQKEKVWLPLILDTHGCIQLALEDFKEGEKTLRQAIEIGKSLESRDSNHWAVAVGHLGTLARRRGEYLNAIENHNKCLEMSDSFKDKYAVCVSRANLAADLLRMDYVQEASQQFSEAKKMAKRYKFGYILTQIDFHQAWAAHLRGEEDKQFKSLNTALVRSKTHFQNHFIIQEGKISLPLFTFALENQIEIEYVSWILEKIGSPSLVAIEPLLNNQDSLVRANAADLIGKIGDTDGIVLLRRIFRDENSHVREKVHSSLKMLRRNLKTPGEVLTSRETQILGLVATGLPNAQIANQLFISEQTVKTHNNRIFKKLGLANRLEAALFHQKVENEKNTTFQN